MVLLEFSISPMDKGVSVSSYVARSLDIIDKSGLPYQLHAMGTIIEGEMQEVMAVLQQCLDAMVTDCDRITCTAKLDYRQGYTGRLAAKPTSVEAHLGRQLNKGLVNDS